MTHGSSPPGWYRDTDNAAGLRYWDGLRWTDHRCPGPAQPPGMASLPPPIHAPAPAFGYGTVYRPARWRPPRIVLQTALVAAIVAAGWFFIGPDDGTNQWYQKGYDIGYGITKDDVTDDAKVACGIATEGTVKLGDPNYRGRKRQVERGCYDGFHDRNDT